jgi:hypothetical protein
MPLVWELTSEIKNWLTPDKISELNAGWRLQRAGHSDLVINDLISMLEALRITPAMSLGVADHIWTIGELIEAALASAPIDRHRKRRFKIIEGGPE